jgi:hypothetical protein
LIVAAGYFAAFPALWLIKMIFYEPLFYHHFRLWASFAGLNLFFRGKSEGRCTEGWSFIMNYGNIFIDTPLYTHKRIGCSVTYILSQFLHIYKFFHS